MDVAVEYDLFAGQSLSRQVESAVHVTIPNRYAVRVTT